MLKKLPAFLLLLYGPAAYADIGNRDYGDALFLGAWTYITFIFSCITVPCILLYMLAGWRSRIHKAGLLLYALLPMTVYGIYFRFEHYYRDSYTRHSAFATKPSELSYMACIIAAGFVLNALFILWQSSKPKQAV